MRLGLTKATAGLPFCIFNAANIICHGRLLKKSLGFIPAEAGIQMYRISPLAARPKTIHNQLLALCAPEP
jgi:hypothetical protein